jgi:ankyrin repeat protein
MPEKETCELINICREIRETNRGNTSFASVELWLEKHKENPKLIKAAASFQDSRGMTPLHYILLYSPPSKILRKIIDLAPNATMIQDNYGELLLHAACKGSSTTENLLILLEAYPIALKVQDKWGSLPLHHILFYNNSDDCKKMILKKYPLAAKVKDDNGNLPFHIALSHYASKKVCKMLFKAYKKAVEIKNNYGMLPLHVVFIYKTRQEHVIKMILKAYPKAVEVKDEEGCLPLHHACFHEASHNMIKLLLEMYPNGIRVKNDNNELPLHKACHNNLLKDDTPERLHLIISAYPEALDEKSKNIGFPSDYLTDGLREFTIGCDDRNHLGLHKTITNKLSPHLLKLLVNSFPQLCLKQDDHGMTPLHYACSSDSPNFFCYVMIFLEANEDWFQVKIQDEMGRTPMNLLSLKASCEDENKMLPLHHLMASSVSVSEKGLQLLICAYPESIYKTDKYGMVPFHYACQNQAVSLEVLMLLIQLFPEALTFL